MISSESPFKGKKIVVNGVTPDQDRSSGIPAYVFAEGYTALIISYQAAATEATASRPAALKILKSSKASNIDHIKAMRREAQLLKQLESVETDRLRVINCSADKDDAMCQVEVVGEDGQPFASYSSPYIVAPMFYRGTTLTRLIEDARESPHFGVRTLTSATLHLLRELQASERARIIHLDLHPSNVLVDRTNDDKYQEEVIAGAKFIDFGCGIAITDLLPGSQVSHIQTLTANRSQDTTAWFSNFTHPDLLNAERSGKLTHDFVLRDSPYRFDRYSIGCCLEALAQACKGLVRNKEVGAAATQISRIAGKLKDVDSNMHILVGKLIDELVELESNFLVRLEAVRLPGQLNVQLPKSFLEGLIDTYEFQRLRKVRQLNCTYLVYPGATHDRFSHSLGVYHACGLYIDALQRNSVLFRQNVDKEQRRLIRLAALLHDIGHYPFAHYFEELLKEGLKTALPLHHEQVGDSMLQPQPVGKEKSLLEKLKDKFNHTVVADINQVMQSSNSIMQIIDGPIDCDKMDYLRRDGLSCGVPYADSIDIQRFLESLELITPGKARFPAAELGITAKGTAPVESLFNARFQLYSEVYWHKTCRMFTVLMKHALVLLLHPYQHISEQEWYVVVRNKDDSQFLDWMATKLDAAGYNIQANDLIRRPLIDGRRDAFYKRVATFSAQWHQEGKNNASHEKLCKVKTLADADLVRRAIIKLLNEAVFASNPLSDHHLLFDHFAAQTHGADPGKPALKVLYATNAHGEESIQPFGTISGLYANTGGEAYAFEATKKFRFFLHRGKYGLTNEAGREKMKKIIEDVVDNLR